MRCTVELLGFPPADQRTLIATFSLSARRAISFAQWQPGAPDAPNLLMVDGDSALVSELLAARRSQLNAGIPLVIVGAKVPSTAGNFLERPIRFLQLFKLLDGLLAASQNSAPASVPVETAPALAPAQVSAAAPATPVAFSTPLAASTTGPLSTAMAPMQASTPRMPERLAPPVQPNYLSARSADKSQSTAPLDNHQAGDWVLVVDDNLAVRRFMAQKLEQFNINVDFAASGEQAIGLTGTKHYTCIFLDVVMPGIDGYQVCKLIKGNRVSKDVKVVMLTSRDSPFDKIRGKMAGCDAYLTKPVDEEKLMNTIVRFLPEGALMSDAIDKNSMFSSS